MPEREMFRERDISVLYVFGRLRRVIVGVCDISKRVKTANERVRNIRESNIENVVQNINFNDCRRRKRN